MNRPHVVRPNRHEDHVLKTPVMTREDERRIYAQVRQDAAAEQDEDYLEWLAEDPSRQEKDAYARNIWNDPQFVKALQLAEHKTTTPASVRWLRSQLARPTWLAAAASVLAVAVMLTNLVTAPPQAPIMEQVYQTPVQQMQRQALADGSTANLNARTKVGVSYTAEQRHIQLFEGEARFSVRKDASRPFTVVTRQAKMEALGTVFNVDQRGQVTELAVFEGQVAITPAGNPQARKVIRAGERLTVTKNSLRDITRFDPEQDKNWLHGWVTVDGMPLSELLIKLNRFSAVPVYAGDATTENLLVSGGFELGELDKNLEILATLHSLDIQRSPAGITLQKR